jgi:hypothetical protein
MESTQQNTSKIEIRSRNWNGLYRTSAIMLILTAVAWTVVTWTARGLYASGYPGDPAAYLQLVAQHQGLAVLTWSLWIVSDFLLIAPTVAFYILLARYNKTLALLGSVLSMFFNIYDVSVTELNSLTLVNLAQGYAGASSEAARAALVAAAAYGYYALPIQTILSFMIGTLGYILWCVPMWKAKDIFRRWVVFFGAFWSLVGLIGSAAPLVPTSALLGWCQFLCVPMVALWFLFLAVQLLRYARRIPEEAGSTERMLHEVKQPA